VLDIVGFRYQWGVEGWKEFRMGAGILYIKDPFTSPDDSTKTVDHFNLATQLNINAFGGFIVGVGYVVTNAGSPGSAFWREDRIRVLVGADLIKLITGIKMEAFWRQVIVGIGRREGRRLLDALDFCVWGCTLSGFPSLVGFANCFYRSLQSG
jgi:hypothetical protein